MTDFSARVARGMDLLDRDLPGWTDKVDLTTLDVGSVCGCVLGQTFGHFSDGMIAVGLPEISDEIDNTPASDHGFDLTTVELNDRRELLEERGFAVTTISEWRAEMYAPLTDAWREAIVARRLALTLVQ